MRVSNPNAVVKVSDDLSNTTRAHPQVRTTNVIAIEHAGDDMIVPTTDIHLPRRVGEALKRAYHGELETKFDDSAYFVRLDWYPPTK